MARQTTFYNAKAVEVSTPTVKNASAIEAAYATGTMERWKSLCPHCGEYHEIRWENIRYESEEKIIAGKISSMFVPAVAVSVLKQKSSDSLRDGKQKTQMHMSRACALFGSMLLFRSGQRGSLSF